MNAELEALEKLMNEIRGFLKIQDFIEFSKNYQTIKSALERKEKLEKVWEIVKTKKVDFRLLKKCDDTNTYNYLYAQRYCYEPDYIDNQFVETEFNLLKEIM